MTEGQMRKRARRSAPLRFNYSWGWFTSAHGWAVAFQDTTHAQLSYSEWSTLVGQFDTYQGMKVYVTKSEAFHAFLSALRIR